MEDKNYFNQELDQSPIFLKLTKKGKPSFFQADKLSHLVRPTPAAACSYSCTQLLLTSPGAGESHFPLNLPALVQHRTKRAALLVNITITILTQQSTPDVWKGVHADHKDESCPTGASAFCRRSRLSLPTPAGRSRRASSSHWSSSGLELFICQLMGKGLTPQRRLTIPCFTVLQTQPKTSSKTEIPLRE